MVSDYTPTTEQVRSEYIRSAQSLTRVAVVESDPEAESEFDRWLAQHDADVSAKAFRDASKMASRDGYDELAGRMLRVYGPLRGNNRPEES